MAGILSEEQLLRELRVLYQNRPLQFTKLITKYYKGARAKPEFHMDLDILSSDNLPWEPLRQQLSSGDGEKMSKILGNQPGRVWMLLR
jgi:hypothetical protein